MKIEDIRRQNILFWAEKLGRAALAEKIGYRDTIYLNALCGGHGSFGGRTARKIEKALDLPPGWFDQVHTTAGTGSRVELIMSEIKDWDDKLLAEVEAQIDLIKRRKAGLL